MRKIKKLKKQEFFLKKKKEKVVENSVKVVAVKSAQVSSDQTAKTPNIKSKVATFDIILLNHFDSFLVQVTLSVNMIVQT